MATLRQVKTGELTAAEVARIRELMRDAFAADEHGGFTEEDWQHSIGGTHFLLESDGKIVCHASVITRELHVDGVPLLAAYVEAVATDPAFQRQGLGAQVMRAVGDFIDYDACLLESLLCLRRAGASVIFTYAAIDAARLLTKK